MNKELIVILVQLNLDKVLIFRKFLKINKLNPPAVDPPPVDPPPGEPDTVRLRSGSVSPGADKPDAMAEMLARKVGGIRLM